MGTCTSKGFVIEEDVVASIDNVLGGIGNAIEAATKSDSALTTAMLDLFILYTHWNELSPQARQQLDSRMCELGRAAEIASTDANGHVTALNRLLTTPQLRNLTTAQGRLQADIGKGGNLMMVVEETPEQVAASESKA